MTSFPPTLPNSLLIDPSGVSTVERAIDEDQLTRSGDETVVDSEPTEPPTRSAALSFTRGMNPRAVVAWVRNTHGAEGVQRLAASLPSDVREDLGRALRPALTSWVPFLAHAELLAAVDRMYGEGDMRLLLVVGRAAAHRDVPFLLKPFARFLSPNTILDAWAKVWRLYHSHGTWEISRGERDLQAVVLGRPENHEAFCFAMRGWIEAALIMSGAVFAEVTEEKCAARGAVCCSLRVAWKEKTDAARDRRPRAPA